jgi:hypothetical protein
MFPKPNRCMGDLLNHLQEYAVLPRLLPFLSSPQALGVSYSAGSLGPKHASPFDLAYYVLIK